MEVNLPVNVKVNQDKDGGYSAVIVRRSDEKEYPVLSIRGMSSADVYVKFGLKVAEEESDTPEEDAKAIVDEALVRASTKTNYTATEIQDILLEVRNALGEKSVDEETKDEDGAE